MAFDFEFSAEQEELRASVRRYLAERAPMAYVREQWGDPAGTSDAVWQGLADLGVLGLLVDDDLGGSRRSGGGMVTAGVVLEELGRAVHPGPFVSSAITVPRLLRGLAGKENGDARAALLSGIADGSRRAAAIAMLPTPILESPASSTDDRLTGTATWIRDAAAVDTFVVVALPSDRTEVTYLVDAADAAVDVTPTVDGSSSFATVTFDDAPAVPVNGSHIPGYVDATRCFTEIAVVTQGVGTASRALEIAVEYAKDRQQFGQPIGSFQAVQHLCADMLIDLELGRAGAYYALWAADEAPFDELRRATALTQAWVSDAFARIGASSIQVLGGIGFTWEHDIHLFYKRLLTLQHDGGGTTSHLEALAAHLLD